MSTKTAVIILNWNGKKYLPDCLGSLVKQDYPKEDREFILVDNGSTDDSVKYAEENFPEITIIKNDKNYGFAKGNNIGMKYALDKSYEYLVLLNQDTAVDERWLSELVKAAESDKKIGAVQSLMMYHTKQRETEHPPERLKFHKNDFVGLAFSRAGETTRKKSPLTPPFGYRSRQNSGQAGQALCERGELMVNSWGNNLHFLGFGFCGGNRQKLEIRDLKLEIKDITYASGASVLLRAIVLKEIGEGFDEEYFLYHEDTDLSFKIKMAGYRVVITPKSVMYHKYEFSKSIKKFYYMERNRYRILLTYYKLPTLILIFPAFIAMEAGMWLLAVKGGWAKEKLRAYGYIMNLQNLSDILKKRRYIQRMRKLNDKDFTKNFVGEIMYQEIDNPLLRYIANPIFKIYWKIALSVIFW